jgi:hypothetical protein
MSARALSGACQHFSTLRPAASACQLFSLFSLTSLSLVSEWAILQGMDFLRVALGLVAFAS